MRRRILVALGVATVTGVVASCGDVPTLEDGIAYISPVLLPSPAVAAGDSLRDSLGIAAPLRVKAFDRNDQEIPGVPVSYLTSPLDPGIVIDESGFLRASDSARTVQIIGRIGSRLQTEPKPLDVVFQPDAFSQSITRDSITFDTPAPVSQPLGVTVTSAARGMPRAVRSIVVRYAISRIDPARADTLIALVDDGTPPRMMSADGRTAVDTTDASGVASRRLRFRTSEFDSVQVIVTVKNLKGQPLPGSPATYTVVIRKAAGG